jgi:putative oxidoreductase
MNRFDDAGKLILRLTVGLLMLSHGLHKLINGIDGISALDRDKRMAESAIAYGVYTLVKLLHQSLIILGVLTRPAALDRGGEHDDCRLSCAQSSIVPTD